MLVGVALGKRRTPVDLEELKLLAASAGAEVIAAVTQERERADPASLIGSGKLAELAALVESAGATLVLFDDDLSPAQQRNIEKAVGVRTLDRAQLILDIFAQRAKSREGRLQVELAQLEYLLPRLVGKGVLLSRLGGGIGTRGPGETKLETDRRRIRARITALKRELEHVKTSRQTRRRARRRQAAPVVALVGYTNAGKSTLFNALTASSALASERVFMTLDPLLRRARLGAGEELLLADTVGFVQKLPHTLVAAFRATLEEVLDADLLLHVSDASAEDRVARETAVQAVLAEIGAGDLEILTVLNKSDRLDAARLASLRAERPDAVVVSARTGDGLGDLRSVLSERLALDWRRVRLRFGAHESRAVGGLFALGRVLEQHQVDGAIEVEVELPARSLDRFLARRVS